MTGPQHEPLTPEEREIARRLAQLDAHAGPSPALDARVLAAARAATNAAPAPAHARSARRRPRFAWAAGLGLAASLLLAVGIAWQLRPLPDADVAYSEAPVAATVRSEAAIAEIPAPAALPAPPPEPVARPKPAADETAAGVALEAEQRPRSQASSARADGPVDTNAADAEAPVVFDAPSPVEPPASPRPAQAAPAPPPPPAPAPAREGAAEPQPDLSILPPPADAPAPAAPDRAHELQRKALAEEARRDAASQRQPPSPDRIEATGTRVRREAADAFPDQPYDDAPPASADSPEVRAAWLSRIRELVAEGKPDAARASLAEFHRRYPDAPLPEDLRALLE